ncbi:MAG: hypothetical protein HFJ54_08770 [Clostridia bacterium]|nr:hypothetical protein [Clostridia bacterium]
MEDKFTNTLIVLISIIVLGLGGLYVYKYGGKELIENIIEEKEVSANAVPEDTNSNYKVEKNTIKSEPEDNNLNTQIVIPGVNETIKNSVEPGTTYAHNNKYYYNQLDNYSKALYDALANNIEKLKTGNYVINIDYDFSGILSKSNGNELLEKYHNDAINALNLDIPDLFYLDLSKMRVVIETTTSLFSTKYKLYIDPDECPNYFSNTFSTQIQVENAIAQVEGMKDSVCNTMNTGSTYDKVRKAHDWIIEYLSYEGSSENKGNIYGALTEKKVVCEGYSRLYKYFLDELGIENILVVGTGTNSSGMTEEHMWNYVKIDGMWYAVDITWDDPIVTGGGTLSKSVKHKYFLIGASEFFQNHVEKKNISSTDKIFMLPSISESKY